MDQTAHDLIAGEIEAKLARALEDQLSRYNLTRLERQAVSLTALRELLAVFIAELSDRLHKQNMRCLSFRATCIRKKKEQKNG